MLKLVVLISGNGSNLQAILDSIAEGELKATVTAVISNKAEAYGLVRAQQAEVATEVLSHRDFPDREAFDQTLIGVIDRYAPDIVVMAGFMRILTPGFVEHYANRLLNIHPSLLPKYKGMHTHARALAAGETEHGCSIHFVTAELDGGPVIAQAVVPIQNGDTPDTLATRVHKSEHRLYPLVLSWLAEGRLKAREDLLYLDDQPLNQPEQLRFETE